MSFYIKGTHVTVKDGNVERALRKFKKKVNELGIIQEVRDRQFYEKPSIVKKAAKKAAKNRWQRKQRFM